MEKKPNGSLDNIGFYFLMTLIALSVVSVVGYLLYTLFIG